LPELHDFIVPRLEANETAQKQLEMLKQRAIEYKNSSGAILEGELVPADEPDWWNNK